jgi:hypothetical protein
LADPANQESNMKTVAEEMNHAPLTASNSPKTDEPKTEPAVEKINVHELRRVRKSVKDDCFGPRRADATHWRCKRIEGDRRQTLLFWGDNDVEESEWPIDTLSLEIIRDRWGGGRYIVEFYGTNGAGARVQRGKSSIVHLREIEQVIDVPNAQPAAKSSAMVPALPAGGDLQTVISLLAFLEDRNEKSRAAAAADAKVSLERYKVDVEAQLQRERLASQERIAQLEAMHKGIRAGSGHSAPIDADALAAKIGDAVGSRVDDALADYEPPSDASPPAAESSAATVKALTEALAPILALVAAKLQPTLPPSNGGADPSSQGGGGGEEGAK